MARNLIGILVVAAVLAQGTAQASMAWPVEPASQADCAGHAESDADGDCCPAGALSTGACSAMCGAALALAAMAPEVVVIRGQSRANFRPPVHAGPRYLPLNPPPIA